MPAAFDSTPPHLRLDPSEVPPELALPEEKAAADDDLQASRSHIRWTCYAVLIAVAVGQMSGRILAVNSVDNERLSSYLKSTGRPDWQKQRPFLSANDRSRWATVRALVDYGTYAIDDIHHQPNWDTIDKVYHDGHYYSSKPPLLATILAGEYWVYQQLTGKTLAEHPWEIGRTLLIINQVGLLLVMYLVLGLLVERYGRSDFDRIFVMGCATLGTFLSTFAVVLNNHIFAAAAAMIALYVAMRIVIDQKRNWYYFLLAGFFSAFAAAHDLPALAFFALLGLTLLFQSPLRTLTIGLLGAAVVVGAFLGTNYAAHDTLVMPYAFRGENTLMLNPNEENWYEFQETLPNGRVISSHWSDPKGIDAGEPDPAAYVLHVLVGRHGILSLTPIWLLSLLGMLMWSFDTRTLVSSILSLIFLCAGAVLLTGILNPQIATLAEELNPEFVKLISLAGGCGCLLLAYLLILWRGTPHQILGWLVLVLTVLVLEFYLTRPQGDRNYSGMSSAFRWAFWLTPLWLVVMLPAARLFGRSRVTLVLACLLLTVSSLAAAYPTWNPWTPPIWHDWAVYNGWAQPY